MKQQTKQSRRGPARKSANSQRTNSKRTSTRLQQVSEVLTTLLKFSEPADQSLSRYFRDHPTLGGRDRAQVAQAVFDVLRHLRRYRHDAQTQSGRLEELLAARGLAATLDAEACQKFLSPELIQWSDHCASIDPQSLAAGIRYSLPEWILQALNELAEPQSYAQALLMGADIDLRVNSMKGGRDEVLAQIQDMLQGSPFGACATPHSSEGIRLSGHPPVNRWVLFEQGVVEVQDEGSQLLAQLVAPKRGEMVIDFCAGAGGKTLALGAMMRSTGRLYAFDVSAARLARAKPRFARSGLSNVHPVVIRSERDDRVARLSGKAHRVLVDAPCTGLGTLRRNPDLKWRHTPEDLARLCEQQASILKQAARCVRPGGTLVYATCSFLSQENEQQVQDFLADHPEFDLVNAASLLPDSIERAVDDKGMVRVRPDWHGTDGFFAAVMGKKQAE